MNIMIVRDAGCVERYHTVRKIRSQSIAEHSWQVAQLVYAVSPAPSPELIKAALNHDVPEIVTGDIPATFKWGNDILVAMLDNVEKAFHKRVGTEWGELSKEEQHILKWCDTMELVLWCIEEKQMGNSAIGPVLDNGFMYLGRLGHPTERAFNLFNYIAESMEP